MTKPNTAHIAILLDRSASMGAVHDATIEGFNAFINRQKENPGVKTEVTFIQFDDKYEQKYDSLPLENVPALSKETYKPRGNTALYDAIGKAVTQLGEKFAAQPENERPAKVIFVIQTDGEENASKEVNREQVFAMISRQRTAYSWEFVFLGANIDAIGTARQLGINAAAALQYNANALSTRKAFGTMGQQVNSYRIGSASNVKYSSVLRSAVTDANVSETELEKLLKDEQKDKTTV